MLFHRSVRETFIRTFDLSHRKLVFDAIPKSSNLFVNTVEISKRIKNSL